MNNNSSYHLDSMHPVPLMFIKHYLSHLCAIGTIIITSLFQMKKLRYRMVKRFSRSYS